MAKLPSFQFYPGDWMKDPALRACSLGARGMWLDLLCLMFECDRRGYLQINGKPMSLEQIARSTGCSTDEASRFLQELEDSGVFSRSEHGLIYSRRLVRDDQIRAARRDAGSVGGSKTQAKRQATSKQSSSPSSSSSTSPSKEPPYPLGGFSAAFQMAWDSWPPKRRVKKQTAQSAWTDAVSRLAFRFDGENRKAEDWLLERVRAYVRSPRANGRYCLGIANWLVDGNYDDPQEAWSDGGEEAPADSAYQEIQPA